MQNHERTRKIVQTCHTIGASDALAVFAINGDSDLETSSGNSIYGSGHCGRLCDLLRTAYYPCLAVNWPG